MTVFDAEIADQLMTIAQHVSIHDLCALRETCSLWRAQIDSVADNSEEWRLLACAQLGSPLCLGAQGAAPAGTTWVRACRVLAHHPATIPWLASSSHASGLGSMTVSPDSVNRLLDWFAVAAEVAAVDCQVAFSTVLNGEARSQASLAIYTACSQKPPLNMQSQVYAWWLGRAFEIVDAIRSRMAHADEPAQRRARASFQSFVKLMTSVVLPYLDRFYVRRFEVAGDAASSLPTVREIGKRAVAVLEHPFDTPLPTAALEPCPEVPLTADMDVDEVALAARQRRAWHQRDLERFEEILLHSEGPTMQADAN